MIQNLPLESAESSAAYLGTEWAQHSMTASTIPGEVTRGTNYCTVHN